MIALNGPTTFATSNVVVSDMTPTVAYHRYPDRIEIWVYNQGPAYGYAPVVATESPEVAKLRRMLERVRAAVAKFAELARRLPLREQRVASRVVEPTPSQLVGLKRWKRRTCGEHNRYRVMV